ncbi:MAG: STAS domain-containing protein [Pseudomonadota bacterium]
MTDTKDDAVMTLAGELTIKTVESLQADFVAQIEKETPTVVDASDVSSIDTAALQLLVAFANEHVNQGGSLQWQGVSDTLQEQATRLGLHQILDFDAEATGATTAGDNLLPVF